METTIMGYMGGCQNYGPFLGTLTIRCRSRIGTQKGTRILTTTHIHVEIALGYPGTSPRRSAVNPEPLGLKKQNKLQQNL